MKIIEEEKESIKSDKKTSNKNYKQFIKIMENENNNESRYFKNTMSIKQQSDTIKKLKKLKRLTILINHI